MNCWRAGRRLEVAANLEADDSSGDTNHMAAAPGAHGRALGRGTGRACYPRHSNYRWEHGEANSNYGCPGDMKPCIEVAHKPKPKPKPKHKPTHEPTVSSSSASYAPTTAAPTTIPTTAAPTTAAPTTAAPTTAAPTTA